MIGALLLLLVIAIETAWIQPLLVSLRPAEPGVELAFWNFILPIAGAALGKMFGGGSKRSSGGVVSDGDPMGVEDDGGDGFSWGAAAPYLGAGAGLAGAMLAGRGRKARAPRQSPLDDLLAFQTARMQQAEPLQQALIAMQAGMLPTYMRGPGSAVETWLQTHDAANRTAAAAAPRAMPRAIPGARRVWTE